MLKYVGIHSFPKSGNTFVRSILSHLLFTEGFNVIPDYHREDVTQAPVFAHSSGEQFRFYKSHCAYLPKDYKGVDLPCGFAVYVRRHPLDVFLSSLNYLLLRPEDVDHATLRSRNRFVLPFEKTEDFLRRKRHLDPYFKAFVVFGTLIPTFFAAGTWLSHWQFWGSVSQVELLAFRYEDLVADPVGVLEGLAGRLGRSRGALETALVAAQGET